jgi:hypothetical protein
MIQDFEILSKALDNILVNSLGNKYLINSYFRISKVTPEQTQKYSLLYSKIPTIVLLVWSLASIPLNVFKFLLTLTLSVIFFKQNSSFKQKIGNTQVVFLTHGTKSNLLDAKKDNYFNLLPNNFQNSKKVKCTLFYTNQSNFRFKRNSKLLDQKNPELTHILLPKFLPAGEHGKYILMVGFQAIRVLKLGLRNYLKNPDTSRILLCSIPWYFSRATYTNFLLLNRLKETQRKNAISSLFLTFEGHSYEQLLVDKIQESGEKTKIFLYQHSPIVPLHCGIKTFLGQCKSDLTVLTTGVFYSKYFQSISTIPSYKVIGTYKSSPHVIYENAKKSNKIVYAPEGTNFATKEFADLIKYIIKDSPEYSHFLRLHPDIKLNLRLKLKLRLLEKYDNFFISGNDLESDLTSAKYLVYRSSAVGIESLKHDLLPIFYAEEKFSGLNVLISNTTVYCKAQNPSEVLNILKSCQNKLSKDQRSDLFNSYFSSIDYKNFRETISKSVISQ